MSRISNILGKLQDTMFWKYDKPFDVEEGSLSGGSEFINQYPPDDDEDVDVPETVDEPYVTHRPFMLPTGSKKGNKLPFESKGIKEQEEDDPEEMAAKAAETGETLAGEEDTEAAGGDVAEPAMGDEAGMGDEAAMGDVGGMGGMGDAGMGMPGMEQEEPKTAGQLGRIYELKKIYSRLTSIESYLGNESATGFF